MTQDEKNRKIAEWLGWTAEPFQSGTGIAYWHSPKCGANPIHMSPKCDFPTHSLTIPNFYTDEAANALVLERLPAPTVRRYPNVHVTGMWTCQVSASFTEVEAPDRKTAIVAAALQWIEEENKHSRQ